MAANARAAATGAVLGVALTLLVGSCAVPDPEVDGIPVRGVARTEALYARHCAVCHGADGGGDGPAAPYLYPTPRDFGQGRFRLVRTENGAPTDADLIGCLERGMPGGAMPSFAWLPADDLAALAHQVRALAIERMARDLRGRYEQAGRPLSSEQAQEVATWRLTPGREVVVPPPRTEPDDQVLARGRVVFLERCAACHGPDGAGQTPDRSWSAFDGLYWARDLGRGLMKGGARHEDLARRVLAGMPGVAMPPARFANPDDAVALLAYLRSILPSDADQRGVQRRQQLRALRVDAVPEDPADDGWNDAPPIDAVLMALACREDCIESAELRALYDGTRIAVRVSWSDPTRDDRAIGGASRWADQCALQVSADELPPLFGMGSHESKVDIWHWAAFRAREVAGALDLILDPRVDAAPATAPGLLGPNDRADEVESRGLPGASRTVAEGAIQARPLYRDGRWHVVFVRELDRGPDAGTVLRRGASIQLCCAIWNGSAEDRGARKAISTWHELRLE